MITKKEFKITLQKVIKQKEEIMHKNYWSSTIPFDNSGLDFDTRMDIILYYRAEGYKEAVENILDLFKWLEVK